MCLTTDNASSNGTFVHELVSETTTYDNHFEKDQWIRCFAHVVNLAVQDSLEPMMPLFEKVKEEE